MKHITTIFLLFANIIFSLANIVEINNQNLGAQLASPGGYFSINLGQVFFSSQFEANKDQIHFSYANIDNNDIILSISERSNIGLTKNITGGIDTYFAASSLDYATVTESQISNIEKSSDKKINIQVGKTYEFVTPKYKGLIHINSVSNNQIYSVLNLSIKRIDNVLPHVNILDDNFKSHLLLNIDTNGDGEIQFSEAEAITTLDVSYKNISNLAGIEAFTNLEKLNCSNNVLVNINISKNTALEELYSQDNQLTSLNVANNILLTKLECHNNQITGLNVSTNIALTRLNCRENNEITTLNFSNNKNLTFLDCFNVKLAGLNLDGADNLVELYCNNNNLQNLDLSKNPVLSIVDCNYNNLTILNLNGADNLAELSCNYNNLINLDISTNTELKELYCINNALTKLDVSTNLNLTNLVSINNQIDIICVNSSQNTSDWIKDNTSNYSTNCDITTSLLNYNQHSSAVVKAYNLQGVEVPIDTKNELIILFYNDGKTEKIIQY